MEVTEDGFLEELLALRRETWDQSNQSTVVPEINGFFSTTTNTAWAFEGLDSTTSATPTTPILQNNTTLSSYDSFTPSTNNNEPTTTTLDCSTFTDFYLNSISSSTAVPPLLGGDQILSPPATGDSSYPGPGPGYEDNEQGHVHSTCKAEPSGEIIPPSFNIGMCMERNNNIASSTNNNTSTSKSKVKRVEGQPSKNLMAERRRRKRLNDRLSMLRSVVPKISKMDRTSILGDTIDYMKELLERINSLQEEIDVGSNQLNVMSIFKDAKPSDVLVRNSPKFDVERRNLDTRVEICCAGKPGLLLSTVTTLEALGLEIQQCVISCFNDFSLQASCGEEMEQRTLISSEEIKQALFRNAGYGGRCL